MFDGSEQTARLKKKQKVCADTTRQSLGAVLAAVQAAEAKLRCGTNNDVAGVLSKLGNDVKKCKVSKTIGNTTRDLHESIKQFGKDIEENFESDLCLATRRKSLPTAALNKVISDHLYREGLFDVGDILVREANIAGEVKQIKERFFDMHRIMNQMKKGDLQCALDWAVQNRPALVTTGAPSAFEFRLHTILYLRTLSSHGMVAALQYAREHFDMFKSHHMAEIQKLMCCLVYASKPLNESPYRHLVDTSTSDGVIQDFVREACGLLGQAAESPLLVSVAAGSVALPQLLKVVKVMGKQSTSGMVPIDTCESLTVELELGPEFNFHSIFACPVSREQSSSSNPPTMLPCGHVLCLQSMNNIPKLNHSHFKCPYCPKEACPSDCFTLHFPDVR